MTRHYSYDDEGADYQCHYCNVPIVENQMLYSTEHNGVELYFCSKSCLYAWDDVDDFADEYYDS